MLCVYVKRERERDDYFCEDRYGVCFWRERERDVEKLLISTKRNVVRVCGERERERERE